MSNLSNKIFFYTLFFFCIINSYLIFPPSYNYGDQIQVNMHLHKHLLDYENENTDLNYIEYYKSKYTNFHRERFEEENYRGKYGIADTIHYTSDAEQVKVTTRLLEYLPYKFLNRLISIEKIITFSNFIILFFTLIFTFKFGKLILNKEYGAILMVLIASNIYFNQLLRSSMQNEVLIYPLLLTANFYYLFKFFVKKFSIKSVLLFSLFLSLNFNNGYPNSTGILLPLIILQMIFLYFLPYFNINKFGIRRPETINILILFVSTFFFTISISIYWSLIHGYTPLHILSLSTLRLDRIYGSDGLAFATGSIIDGFGIYSIYDFISNFFDVLINPSRIYNAPHEPGFLLKNSYISLVESIFFVYGIFLIFKKFNFNNFIKLFFIGLLFLLIIRAITDRLWYVSKANYDCFFLVHFFSAIGIYYFPSKQINLYLNEIKNLINFEIIKTKTIFLIKYGFNTSFEIINQKKKEFLLIPIYYKLFFLCIILAINTYNFNYKFIYKYNENLGLHSGIYQVKDFLKNNLKDNNDLLIINWLWSDVFYIDFITDLKSNYEVDILKKEIFEDPNYRNYFKKFNNVYFLRPAETSTIAGRNQIHGVRTRANVLYENYFSIRNYDEVIKDRSGKPLYYISKILNDKIHKKIKIESILDNSEKIKLTSQYYLNYIDIPSYVSKVEIFCNNQNYNFDFSKSNADYIHLDFKDDSVAEIYNDLNKNNKSIINEQNIQFSNAKDDKFPWRSDANYIFSKGGHQGNAAYVDFEHIFPFNLNDVTLTVPYLIFNDKNRNNSVEVFVKERNKFNKIEKIISDKSEKYGSWTWMPPSDIFKSNNVSSVIDYISSNYKFKGDSNQLVYRLKLRKQKWGYIYASRFISTSSPKPEDKPFFLIIHSSISNDVKKGIRMCNNEVKINFEFNDKFDKDKFIQYGLRKTN